MAGKYGWVDHRIRRPPDAPAAGCAGRRMRRPPDGTITAGFTQPAK